MKTLIALLALPLAAQYQTVYPLSVVPGGIVQNSPYEASVAARQAWASAGLDMRHLHAATLPAGEYLVQHRSGETLGWSQMHLSAQIALMDDSGRAIRLQCGNSVMPLRADFVAPPSIDLPPTLIDVPAAPLLFIPVEYAGLMVELPPIPEAPAETSEPFQYPPQIPGHMNPPWSGMQPPSPLHPPPRATPEPAGLILAGIGLLVIELIIRRRAS